jgi:hypothetical protein
MTRRGSRPYQRLAQCLEQCRHQEGSKSDWKAVERGWFLGDRTFKEELLNRRRSIGTSLLQAVVAWSPAHSA